MISHPYDWKQATKTTLTTGMANEALASVTREALTDNMALTSRRTSMASMSSGMALDSWSSTTEGVKQRLEQEYAAVQLEISELASERARAAAFRAALLPGQQAGVDAQAVRSQRPERELIFDPAAVALRDQGVDTAQSLQLMDTVDNACETELGRLDLTLGQLAQSVELKKAHLSIDNSCRSGSIPQTSLSAGSGQPISPPGNRSKLLPYKWKSNAQETVNKSAQSCTVSQRVRAKSLKSQQDVHILQDRLYKASASSFEGKAGKTATFSPKLGPQQLGFLSQKAPNLPPRTPHTRSP